MVQQLIEAIDDLYLEKRVRAIIITGAGDSFSLGADVGEMQTSQESETPEEEWGADAADFRDLVVRMMEITKPIIAAVNGPAMSAGAALVAAADIVVASDGATLGLPDARLRHGGGTRGAAHLVSDRRRPSGAAAADGSDDRRGGSPPDRAIP